MKIRRIISALLLTAMLLSACAADNPKNTSAPTDPVPGADPNYGAIGDVNGVQYDEKYGNLISPYTRLQISLEQGAETFAYLDGQGKACYSASSQVQTQFAGKQATVTQRWNGTTSLTTSFLAQDDGSMDIVQKMEVSDGGISGLRFRLTVPMKYSVIIPAWNGICLNAEHPEIYDKRTTLSYPREWQAQMLLIQGANGGVLIQANDNGSQFKALNIENDGENFYLELCTIPQAPFTDYTSFETVTWSVIPYEGGWMNGALIYKQYMNDTFKLSELNNRQPEWVKDIQLVWMDDLDSKEKLDLLAEEVNPAQTLIQIPGWRAAAYDTEYPDYTPKESIQEMIDYAHSLGFRVSLHCNMLGCSFSSKEWEAGIKDSACLDAYTKEVIVEGYTAFGIDYRFGQINQASPDWQNLMVERMVELVNRTGVDCIHLDQSLLCFNDGRGLVNGMTTMQGNVELQRKLAEALPDVAFSGEGINEFNMRYADFLQQHVYALDSNADTWNDEDFKQIVPLTSVLFSDYARPYHYPALPTADEENEEQLQAWFRAGEVRAGTIPCLYRESVTSLLEQTETFKLILDTARFYMENRPVINTGEWGKKAIISYVLKDGTIAEWRQSEEDTAFFPNAAEDRFTTLFVHNTSSYTTDRDLKNWILYDEDSLKGLLENKTYLLLDRKRDPNVTHIVELEKNLTARGYIFSEAYTAIALQEVIPSNKRVVDFTAYDGAMRAGEVLYDGATDMKDHFNSMTAFWWTFKDQGQVRHLGDRIMFHPPWHNEVDSIGYSWMEVDVPLEVVGNARFTASFQLATAESAAGSDGVIFRVYAWDKADTGKTNVVSQEIVCLNEIALPLALDLTQFEGKTVTVRIECYTGKTPRNDSCLMVTPQVVQDMGVVERTITYTMKTEKEVKGIMSLTGKATCESLGDNQYRITCDIRDTVWLLHDVKPVSNQEDLTVYPFLSAWKPDTGEVIAPTGDLAPQQQVAESNYELRNGIFQHPPQSGVSELSWLITLPESGNLRFSTAIAMKKGSIQSDGVTFSVLVNGQEVFTRFKEGSSGFEDVSIDLNAYAGQTIILTLRTDSGPTSAYDYAFWGDPLLYTE